MNKLSVVELEELAKKTIKLSYQTKLVDRKITALGSANNKIVELFTELLDVIDKNDIATYEEKNKIITDTLLQLERTNVDIVTSINNIKEKLDTTKVDITDLHSIYHNSIIKQSAEIELWSKAYDKQAESLTKRVNTYIEQVTNINTDEKLLDLEAKLDNIEKLLESYQTTQSEISDKADKSLDIIEQNVETIIKNIDQNKINIENVNNEINTLAKGVDVLSEQLKDVEINIPSDMETLFNASDVDDVEEDDNENKITSFLSRFFG